MDENLFLKLKLLIVDDTEDVQEIMEGLLSEGFTHVAFASTASEAIVKLTNDRFVCMILDLNLGDTRGGDVIHFLNSDTRNLNYNIPVIVISAFLPDDFKESYSANFAGVLHKPFDHIELRKLVSDILLKTYPTL